MESRRARRTGTALTATLLVLTVTSCLLSCAATRGRWSGGWYSEQLSLKGGGQSKRIELRYHPGTPGDSWITSTSAASDVAFYNEGLGATMYADSSCGARYEDAPLVVLLNHLLFGFTEVKVSAEYERELAGRASLTREASARLDGVPIEVAATVTKNGPCVFDLVFVGAPGSLQMAKEQHQSFLSGLTVEYRP
jgi:hypothetical protein